MSVATPNVNSIKERTGTDLKDDATRRRALYFWGLCYLDEVGAESGDCHQAFANLLECSRQDAKEICYVIHYVSNCHASKFLIEKYKDYKEFQETRKNVLTTETE